MRTPARLSDGWLPCAAVNVSFSSSQRIMQPKLNVAVTGSRARLVPGNGDVVARLADLIDLDRRRPVVLELARNLHAADALQPRAHLHLGAVGGLDFGQVRRVRIEGLVRSAFRMHVLQDRIESA